MFIFIFDYEAVQFFFHLQLVYGEQRALCHKEIFALQQYLNKTDIDFEDAKDDFLSAYWKTSCLTRIAFVKTLVHSLFAKDNTKT